MKGVNIPTAHMRGCVAVRTTDSYINSPSLESSPWQQNVRWEPRGMYTNTKQKLG